MTFPSSVSCLLFSPAIGQYLYMPIVDRILTFRTDEGSIIYSCRLDIWLLDELATEDGVGSSILKEIIELYNSIEQIQMYKLSSYQTVTV